MNFIIQFISHFGYFAVFIFMTMESALIPIPSEVTLPFAGFLAQNGHLNLFVVMIVAILGDLVGTSILYAIGVFLEEEVIIRLIDKYGKFILISKHEYTKLMEWINKRGSIIITVGKLLPGFRSIIGLPAGLSEVSYVKTLIFTLIGSVIWCVSFVLLGLILGKNWEILDPIFKKFELVIILAVVLAALWYINHKLKIIKFKK